MAEFVGALTEDIALLSGGDTAAAVSEPPDNQTAVESTDQAAQPAESEPRDANKSLPDSSRGVTTPQPQSLAQQESAAVHDGISEFCNEAIVEALPSWMGDHEKAKLTSQVNTEILRHIQNDKQFMAALNKTYDGSRESLQRGAELLVERWLEQLPYAIQNLNLPKPLTQDEVDDSMDDLAVLSSSRPVQRRPAKSPLRGVVRQ